MKKYTMTVEWVMAAEVEIEASSYEEALEIMESKELKDLNGEYVGDTFEHNIQMNLVLNEGNEEVLEEIEEYHGIKL